MKKIKLLLYILGNSSIVDLVWSIYEAQKDGKLSKEEMLMLNEKTSAMIKSVVQDKVSA